MMKRRQIRRGGRGLRLPGLLIAVVLMVLGIWEGWLADSAGSAVDRVPKPGNLRAMWVTQYDQAAWFLENGRPRTESDFRKSVRQAVGRMAGAGINAVFLQVRPFGDSFYPSAVYPPSAMAVGRSGGQFTYDPLGVWVEETRAVGLALHAWINPFRAMTEGELLQVDPSYALRQWREDEALRGTRIVCVEGRWYLNPADQAARELILSGAAELLARYELAGIHIDDYFYPTTDPAFDAAAYAMAGNGRSLGDFRREQVNLLVRGLWRLCHEAGVLFGISPAGNPDACYARDYADVFLWGREPGYVDYLCPQLYFGFEHQTHGFLSLCAGWQELAAAGGTPLVIGLTLGKAHAGEDPLAGTGRFEWREHSDVLARSAATAAALPNCVGTALFCYQYCWDPVTGNPCAAASAEREGYFAAIGGLWGDADP